MRIIESMPQQRPQEKESILEMLARGLVGGASQSLGQGLGNLATQGLGMLMDPNMKPVNSRALEAMGLNPQQAKAIGSVKNPAFQRDMVLAAQKQQADLQAQQLKQQQASQYAGALDRILGTGSSQAQQATGEQQGQAPLETQDLTVDMVNNLAKIAQKERHAAQTEKHQAWKATEDLRKANKSSYDLANDLDLGIKKMKKLDESGKLDSPEKAMFLKKIGMEQFLEPESALFNKVRAAFMAGAPKAVGGKVSNFELQAHMERFPSLMVSKEGRALIYDDILMMNDLARQAYNVERDIVKENDGNPPLDLQYRIDDRMADVYKKYEQRMLSNIKKAESITSGSQQKQQVMTALPDASANKGRKIRGAEGILVSDGTNWVPETQKAAQPTSTPVQAPVMARPEKRGVARYY